MVHHQFDVGGDAGPVPQAPRRPTVHEAHGQRRDDDYAWLRDTTDPQTLAYLKAEQAYYERSVAHLAGARERLTHELIARSATVTTPCWRQGGRLYFLRWPAGQEHPRLYAAGPDDGAEWLLLDPNLIARQIGDLRLGDLELSDDGRLLAYALGVTGDEAYQIRFRDLATGDDLPDRLTGCGAGGVFDADGSTFFYLALDDAGRPDRVRWHRLGTPCDDDVNLNLEPDPRFALSLRGSRDGRWVVVRSASHDTAWVELIDRRRPLDPSRLIAAPRPGVLYDVEPMPGGWDGAGRDLLLVVTDDGAPEFRLMTAPLPSADGVGDPIEWRPVPRVVAAGGSERLESVCVLGRHLVLSLRADGEPFLRVIGRGPGTAIGERTMREIHAGLPFGQVRLWRAQDPTATRVIVHEQNLVTAPRWVDVDLMSGERAVVARVDVPGVDPTRYVTERLTATSADGTAVPVTIARPADPAPADPDPDAPDPDAPDAPGGPRAVGAVLQAYGAHEQCSWPEFSLATLSLLDRGVVVAVAHVRGGGELGRRWWRDGCAEAKPNGFADLIAARDALVAAGFAGAGAGAVVGRGRSAGGTLQAAVLSRAPGAFAAVVAEAPFVDVLTTLSDPSLPLTARRWGEWGDPIEDAEAFAALRAWSPYDNPPAPGERPALLVTGELHDAEVLVHEPAKWVARLRARDADAGADAGRAPLLFRVGSEPSGYAGPAGRPGRLQDEAEILSWMLDRLGDPAVRP
jgi:oligopeptidase B